MIAPDTGRFADVPHFRRILVPMKLGMIGEEMAATAVKLAARAPARRSRRCTSSRCRSTGRSTPRCPRRTRAPRPRSTRRGRSATSSASRSRPSTIRSRAIGRAIVDRARETDADLIVLGSSPRWRRQSRFFSPTVDFVLRQAPCEVLIVAFPQNVLDEERDRHLIARLTTRLRCVV